MTIPREMMWCDACEFTHIDIIDRHCSQGQHCTYTTAECAAALHVDDHDNKCCDCGKPLK